MARKTKKTNKTDHVLGLLAGRSDDVAETMYSVEGAAAKGDESGAAPGANVQVVAKQEEDEAIADTVKQLLEEELEEEGGAPEAVDLFIDEEEEAEAIRAAEEAARNVEQEVSVSKESVEAVLRAAEEERKAAEEARRAAEAERRAAEEERKAAEEVRKEAVEKEKKAVEEAQKAEEALRKAEEEAIKAAEEEALKMKEKKDEYVFLNVMETLVRERVDTYMDQFSTCHCSRCKADVIALALTSLPSKYVVVSQNAATPLMNFYSQRYAGAITVEITKACTRVREHPHHNRD